MPEIGRIQSTNFQALLTSLGIVRNDVPFALRSEVTPVVLVGGTVSFVAAPTPPYEVTDIFTTGIQVAPLTNTVMADTGPLPAGAYSIQMLYSMTLGNIDIDFEWRNFDNTVNLWTQRFRLESAGTVGTRANIEFSTRLSVANNNERFRVRTASGGTAATDHQASILARI